MLPLCGGNLDHQAIVSTSRVLMPSHDPSIHFTTKEDCRIANASSVRLEPPYGYHTVSHRLGRLSVD
jgi:hypothetical protein